MRPCLPPELQRAADDSERRKNEAIDKLLQALAGEVPMGDPFEASMRVLIDADRLALQAIAERKDR